MALRKLDNLAISVDENIEDEVDLDVEMDDHTKNHRHGIRRWEWFWIIGIGYWLIFQNY